MSKASAQKAVGHFFCHGFEPPATNLQLVAFGLDSLESEQNLVRHGYCSIAYIHSFCAKAQPLVVEQSAA